MARETFQHTRLSADTLTMVHQCNAIIGTYQAQGLRLTLRQLYYQLVTQNVVKNEERSYKNLSATLTQGRMCGLIDWDAIEDRVRRPQGASEFGSLAELVEVAVRSYRLPRWRGQENYVELWVEKDALSGVLFPIAHRHHVQLMVNKGYSSASAMYEAAKRFLEACGEPHDYCHNCLGDGACSKCGGSGRDEAVSKARKPPCPKCDGKKVCWECAGRGWAEAMEVEARGYTRIPHLLYLGDFDPSGEDMVRDVRERLETFGVHGIKVEKIALTPAQIKQYKPPPNPAKLTDPRAAEFVRKYGGSSFEVDALPPTVLTQLVDDAIAPLIDDAELDAVKKQEATDLRRLRAMVGKGS